MMARFRLPTVISGQTDFDLRIREITRVFTNRVVAQTVTFVALILGDLLAFCLAIAVISASLVWLDLLPLQSITHHTIIMQNAEALLGTGLFGLVLYSAGSGCYVRWSPFSSEFRLLACSSLFVLTLSVMLATLLPGSHAYLGLVAAWLPFPVLALYARKLVRWALRRAGVSHIRMIVFGTVDAVDRLVPSLTDPDGFSGEVAAVMHPEDGVDDLLSYNISGSFLRRYDADVVIVCDDANGDAALTAAASLAREGVPFAVAALDQDRQPSIVHRIDLLGDDVTLRSYRAKACTPSKQVSKVVLDLLIASVCVVAMLPLLVIIAVLVKSDGGPLLFGHTRIGLGGRPFRCLKFRSMVVNSDAVLMSLLESDPVARAEWEETQKLRHDPRVTTIGRLLRVSSLDELPQLINVLRLEMSLVGPRPIVAAEVPRYGNNIKYYHQTRPGLTGLWQISGRSSTGYRQRIELDCCYVRNWSIWKDLAILLKTVPAVLKRHGAY